MSLTDLEVVTLQGKKTTFGELSGGNAVLLVNVASKCGFTRQYEGLQKLQEDMAGLTVIGVPSNQFGAQEPGTAEEIAEFCSTTYGVTFPILAKTDVNGPDRHPLFDELTSYADEAGYVGDVRWNFEKWLLSRDGKVLSRFGTGTEPNDPVLVAAIDAALA
ncbi:MAG: glutathione peroxidase [Actinomycetota bacterium]|jgi:glutathione peroxidase|nr:glutathione peroxidase [Actinomycetota bacterium]